MYNSSISLVFPAYNEASNLEELITDAYNSASKISDDFEIIVVNDGSTDGSRELLQCLSPKFGAALKPIDIYPNAGYANAIKRGFQAASKELIFYSDADNQFDLGELGLLMENLLDNDMVIGFRKDRKDNALRLLVSKCYNFLVRSAFGLNVRDIDCAFKLFRKGVFERIEIKHEKFLLDTEILAKARLFNMKIAQVGVSHLPRTKGKTTVKPADVLFTIKGLFKLKRELKRINNDA